MANREINIEKRNITLVVGIIITLLILLLTALLFVFFTANQSVFQKTNDLEITTLESKFVLLSKTNSNSCGGTFNYVDSMPDNSRIQGSCCSPMNFHRYSEQIKGLKKYAEYKKIPPDPYDVSVSLAKELLNYQKNIILTDKQQSIYDEAISLSDEGPCCCKCWHWYAYEGLAKYLIVEEGFTAQQIAEVWDLSEACGGSGHVKGEGNS